MAPKTPKPDLEAKRKREQEELEARYKGPGVIMPARNAREWFEAQDGERKPNLELTGRAAEIDQQWVKPAQQSPDARVLDTPPDYQGREAEDADLDGTNMFSDGAVPEDIAALPDDYLFVNDDDLTQAGMSTDEAGWTTMEQTDPDKHR